MKRQNRIHNERLFVERREAGDYAVRRPTSERASAVEPDPGGSHQNSTGAQPREGTASPKESGTRVAESQINGGSPELEEEEHNVQHRHLGAVSTLASSIH